MTYLSLILFALATVFYCMSQKRVFAESDEWRNKYKQPMRPAPNTWYYKMTGLKYKERFPLSGSLLVLFTDWYHHFQFWFKAFLCTSIAFYAPLFGYWDALLYFVLFGLVFTIVYKLLS
ncbi:MAG TPA: hypothetical protein VK589_06090 [Chryseolinea sp.]|nr:hypothetical protein [Chryseolinea sp.]